VADSVIDTGRPTQHRVLKQLTLAVANLIETGVAECVGRQVPVKFEYVEPGRKIEEHYTLLQYWLERVTDRHPDRVLCKSNDGGEYFRNAPLIMTARYCLTAWAHVPDDQELLGAALRVLYDNPELKAQGGKAEEDAIHFEDAPMIDLSTRHSFDEQRIIAESFKMPLRPSLRVDATFRLDSERKTTVKRVKERIVDYRKLES
jgi:hypothetical protein